jgi:dienelactone hydrolase
VEPTEVSFPCGELTLHGFLWKPEGEGPFPAIVYNHGSEKLPGSFPSLGNFWTAHGFMFFVPHRHGHGRSPGQYIVDLEDEFRATEKDPAKLQRHSIELHEHYNADVVSAVTWLKMQPGVDQERIAVAGISYGGIQTLLTAEKDLGVAAFVAFSPAAMSWRGNPLLRERLLQAIKKATAPMFLLQAKNDYNLGPSELLGTELTRKGAPNRAKLYPPFGDANDPRDGHGGFAVRGSEVWGQDVLDFLNAVPSTRP